MPLFRRPAPPPPGVPPPGAPEPHRPPTVPVLLAPSGSEAVVVGEGHVTRWDLTDVTAPLATRAVTGPHTRVVTNGQLLVWGERSGSSGTDLVRIHRWDDLTEVRTVELPEEMITVLDLSPDGARLAVGGLHERITLIDVATGRTALVPRPDGEGGGIQGALRWSPDGTVLAELQVGQGGGSFELHRVRRDGSVAESVEVDVDNEDDWYELADAYASIEYSPDGRSMYCSVVPGVDYCPNHILRCDTGTGRIDWTRPLDRSLAVGSEAVEGDFHGVLSVSHDGRLVLHGNEAGELLAFAAGTGRLVHRGPLLARGPLTWLTASPADPSFWVAVDAIPQQYPLPPSP